VTTAISAVVRQYRRMPSLRYF